MSQQDMQRFDQARVMPRRVRLAGSGHAQRGRGVCYAPTYGTATQADGTRDNRVNYPTAAANQHFAGVCVANVTRAVDTETVAVDIAEPGSVVEVATLVATTINSTRLTALVSASEDIGGCFISGGMEGCGSAMALQTLAAVTGPTDYSIAPISSSLAGTATSAYSSATNLTTVTATGAFTNVPTTANLQGNEYLYVVAGGTTGTLAVGVTPGRYKIVSKTSNDVVVVEGQIASAASSIAFYCCRGLPVVLARLDFGPQSGLIEWITPLSGVGGSDSTAMDPMTGGTTLVFGGTTLGSSAVWHLRTGHHIGQLKRVLGMGDLTTGDYVMDVVDGGLAAYTIKPAGTGVDAWQAVATVVIDAAAEQVCFEWTGSSWLVTFALGATLTV